MYSVSQLAKAAKVSRSTILYYERCGLLNAKLRGDNGYRYYGENELTRLHSISAYRSYGLPVSEIKQLLTQKNEQLQQSLLRKQFNQLETTINQLRQQQTAIVALLKQPELLENNMVTKQRWVEIMQAAGFSENDMTNWHRQFEQMEPEEHHKFLQSLGIEENEIQQIRAL